MIDREAGSIVFRECSERLAGCRGSVIVPLSGGIDGTVNLYLARALGLDPVVVEFSYAERLDVEARFVEQLCTREQIPRYTIDFPVAVVRDRARRSIAIPQSNAIFYALAASVAASVGASAIVAGQIGDDWTTRDAPECTPEHYAAINRVLEREHPGRGIRVITPLIDLTKVQVVALGSFLGVPFELTYSCSHSYPECGRCDQCVGRSEAFRQFGVFAAPASLGSEVIQ